MIKLSTKAAGIIPVRQFNSRSLVHVNNPLQNICFAALNGGPFNISRSQ